MRGRRHFRTEGLLTGAGWWRPAWFAVGDDGRIVERGRGEPPAESAAERLPGPVLPAMPDLHSHAFQRLLAGRSYRAAPGRDDFWSWRAGMYRLAERLDPAAQRAAAAWLYAELLEGGYAAVGEFHYLHRAGGAKPRENAAALREAAAEAGIDLHLLPVLYVSSGIDERGRHRPLEGAQRLFDAGGVDGYLQLLADLARERGPGFAVGAAPHSLRAVPARALADVRAALPALLGEEAVVHVHAAEQPAEVEAVQRAFGARPVRWLLDEGGAGPGWCLVHATQVDAEERAALAASGAVAGLCPATEADLGDGFFPIEDYLAEGGAFGIGSDAEVELRAGAELRLLDYGARLRLRRRNPLARDGGLGAGARLWLAACAGGARALRRGSGLLEPGDPADFVVLDRAHDRLAGHDFETLADAFVFGGGEGVLEVHVRGRRVVAEGRHPARDRLRRACLEELARLGLVRERGGAP